MAVTAASGIPVPARRRGYALTAGVLLVMMLGGTLGGGPVVVIGDQHVLAEDPFFQRGAGAGGEGNDQNS
jgi:hypothetical protein